MKLRLAPVLVCLAGPVLGQGACPPVPDHEAAKFALLDDLRIARDETEAMLISGDLWRLWTDPPDPSAGQMLNEGIALIRSGDHAAAAARLTELVAYCPDWAEGWNQRAFALYLQGDFAGALPDLLAALERDPHHVGARAGLALSLLALGREDEGQQALRDALALNPWLAERRLLRQRPGQDI